MKGRLPVRGLCALLTVSPSGYYRWAVPRPSPRRCEDEKLKPQILAAHVRSRKNYGAPRVVQELRAQGVALSKRRCTRLMKELGIRGKKRGPRRPRTTDSRYTQRIAPNRLGSAPKPRARDQAWMTDITYLETGQGWLYLAAILDVWSRRVVGWSCGPTLHVNLVLTALQRALHTRRPPRGLLHHSDRGCQYASDDYLAALAVAGCEPSMSRAGNCYDNAAMESFWSTLKTEFASTVPATRREAELAVFDYIETFYNPVRRHSSLGYLSPVAFERTSNHIKVA
jgi:transposase InsO family protein